MDVATHVLVPYAAALAAYGFWRRGHQGDRRKAGIAAVVGVSGFAPDLDGLIDPLSRHFDALFWMQHRGVSHTLLGAPIFALALVALLALAARRWPNRFGLFTWRRAFLPALLLGAWSHLLLDAMTFSGVPLWWPFAYGRVTFPLFSWIVPWLFVPALLVLALHAFGRIPRRRVIEAGALVVLALVVLGGLRLSAMPDDVPDGSLVHPRAHWQEWAVATPHAEKAGSWDVRLYKAGAYGEPMHFAHDVPPAAEDAVARAMDTWSYRGFLMGSFGPLVTVAHPNEAGDGWFVTVTDVAQRHNALHGPRWTPTDPHEDWGYVTFEVMADRIVPLHRGW